MDITSVCKKACTAGQSSGRISAVDATGRVLTRSGQIPNPCWHAHRRPGQRSPGFPLFLRLPGADFPLSAQHANARHIAFLPDVTFAFRHKRFAVCRTPARGAGMPLTHPPCGVCTLDKCGVFRMPLAPRPRPADRGRAPCFPVTRMAGPCSIPGHLAVSRHGCRQCEAHSVPIASWITLAMCNHALAKARDATPTLARAPEQPAGSVKAGQNSPLAAV